MANTPVGHSAHNTPLSLAEKKRKTFTSRRVFGYDLRRARRGFQRGKACWYHSKTSIGLLVRTALLCIRVHLSSIVRVKWKVEARASVATSSGNGDGAFDNTYPIIVLVLDAAVRRSLVFCLRMRIS